MNWNEYQQWTRTTAEYPGCGEKSTMALAYCCLGLTGEAGEVADKVKKILRGDPKAPSVEDIAKELGDVLWYAARLSSELGVNLSWVVEQNVKKIMERKALGIIKGSGDDREQRRKEDLPHHGHADKHRPPGGLHAE
jgi:NTP pyrophosphatase (non-canonical NTP hydrolase)